MAGKSKQTVSAALEAHEKRYGKDLVCLMNRLDEMDSTIHELEIMISRLALKLFDLSGQCAENSPVIAEWPVEERDDCRIIRFPGRN